MSLPECGCGCAGCAECAARHETAAVVVAGTFMTQTRAEDIAALQDGKLDAALRAHRPGNALVHERDRLREEVERLTKQVASLEARTRHHVVLTCDRCRSTLIVGSSLATPDAILTAGLLIMVLEAGWKLGKTTAIALDARAIAATDASDRCPHCARATSVP